jgi:hypothetical protein
MLRTTLLKAKGNAEPPGSRHNSTVGARKNEEVLHTRVSVAAAAAAPSGSILQTHTHIKKANDRDPIAIITNRTRTHAEMGFT